MEPPVRSARTQAAIVPSLGAYPDCESASQIPTTGREFGRSPQPERDAGNEIFRCRDGRGKTALSARRDSNRDPRGFKKLPFRGHKRDIFQNDRVSKTWWWRRKGSNCRPTTQSSNRSPTRARNGIFRCRDRREKMALSTRRDFNRDPSGFKKPPFRRHKRKCFQNDRVRKTWWWARQDSNLQPDRYERGY